MSLRSEKPDTAIEGAGATFTRSFTPNVEGDLFISVKAVEWVLEHSKSKGKARNVLIAIAAHVNSHNYCWPSFDRIARLSNCSRPTVAKCLDELEELEELEVIREEGRQSYYSLPKFDGSWSPPPENWEPVNTSKENPPDQLNSGPKPVKSSKRSKTEQAKSSQSVTEENSSKSESPNNKENNKNKKEEEVPPLPLQAEEKDWKKIAEDNERFRQAKEERKARKANGGRKPFVKHEYVPAERKEYAPNVPRQTATERRSERNEKQINEGARLLREHFARGFNKAL